MRRKLHSSFIVLSKMSRLSSLVYLFFLIIIFSSCSEPAERINFKLDEILQEDLRYIVAEIRSKTNDSFLLDSPYYVINDLRMFHGDSAWKISSYAEVDFFYFKDSVLFQKRKYRYLTRKRAWDRYYKKLLHFGQLKK